VWLNRALWGGRAEQTWYDNGARAEAIKKSLIDGAMVNAALGKLQSALAPALSPTERARLWDEGWAFYVGRDSTLSPFATSNKRAKNYGTMSSRPGISNVNVAVLQALVDGKRAVARPTERKRARTLLMDEFGATTAVNVVLRGVQTTYVQATLRYAYQTDAALAAGISTLQARAEGGAFWRVVAPYVAEYDALGAAAITELYDLSLRVQASPTSSHYYYCLTKRVLMGALPLGVTAADVGTLEDDDGIACGGVERSPPAASAPLPPVATPDCTCKCCAAEMCAEAAFTYGIFAAGSQAMCSPSACRAHFSFCPDDGTHNAGAEVLAHFGTGEEDTTDVAFVNAGAVYVPTTNVAPQLDATDAVCAAKTALAAGDWEAVTAAYEAGSTPALRDLARSAHDESTIHQTFAAHFGSATWLHDFTAAALGGEGLWANDARRSEALEKTMADAILVHSMLTSLQEAQRAMIRGDYAGAAAKWDQGWALYHGRDASCTPYSRADKRGADFGALTWDGVTSLQNVAIGEAFHAGQRAIAVSAVSVPAQTATVNNAVADILANVQVTYLRASVRYAYLLDVDLRNGYPTAEHRGEGWAFWRVVAPFAAAVDEARATHLTQVYDHQFALEVESANYHYCLAMDTVTHTLPTGVTAAMLGTLAGASEIDCAGWEWDEPPTLAELQHNEDADAMPDCQCACCKGEACPATTVQYFHAGGEDQCMPEKCSATFYACPDTTGAEHAVHGGSVTATFMDCMCECDDMLGGFQTNDRGLCTEAMCRAEVGVCTRASTVLPNFNAAPGKKKANVTTAALLGTAGVLVVLALGTVGRRVWLSRRARPKFEFDHRNEATGNDVEIGGGVVRSGNVPNPLKDGVNGGSRSPNGMGLY
jgi:hypothetical protein